MIPRHVLKIGGSLLLKSDWPSQLQAWLAIQPPTQWLLVIGGGEIIEAIRQLDEVHQLDPIQTHWRCIALLDHTFEIASTLVSEARPIRSHSELEALVQITPIQELCMVRVGAFYDSQRLSGRSARLPHNWNCTSDSLAVLLAMNSAANKVTLLKSCEIDQAWSLQELVERGIVDSATLSLFDDSAASLEIQAIQFPNRLAQ